MDAMDAVFKALADPTRRALLGRLGKRNGPTLAELCDGVDMARQSVSKHLAVLEDAGVVTTRWRGREKLHYLDAAPINAVADRWLSRFDRRRAQALADLTTALEATPVNDTADDFVYTTYIRTTPEALWRALTEPAFTSRYWGVELTSDWQVGSTVTWAFAGATMADPAQRVLVADPPYRLSFTWHAITEEFGRAVDADPEVLAAFAAEPLSHVLFEIEQVGEQVKLTVTHGGFEDGSQIREGVSGGWPQILASLKTLLETGEPLPTA
jgi:DNA-binding transcriptional ArsR family regulator/uncharacterized protein YndB with AHSA1/START domain